jgi:hypothetical protein
MNNFLENIQITPHKYNKIQVNRKKYFLIQFTP